MEDRLPYIEISGSHSEVGKAIGEQMRKVIQETIKIRKSEIIDYENLLKKSKEYYHYTSTVFPDLTEELCSIANGADVSKYDYFFINNREVFDMAETYDAKNAIQPDHCTIAVSFNADGCIVGHNEDWHISAMPQLYVLKATINKITFLGVNYATAIPGVAASVNSFGLVQCINDLYQTNQFGVPKNFLARAVLECRTLEEAEKLINSTKRGSGFNHVLVQGKRLSNIEIAGNKSAVERIEDQPYVHTNHYLSPDLQELEKFHTISSEVRYKRATELITQKMSSLDMISLLSDTNDPKYPICRAEDTIASLVFEPAKGLVQICKGHPCGGKYHNYYI